MELDGAAAWSWPLTSGIVGMLRTVDAEVVVQGLQACEMLLRTSGEAVCVDACLALFSFACV